MYLGVDVGGTKTLVAVFDDSGKLLEEKRIPTPQQYSDFVGRLKGLINQFSNHKFNKTVVAIPGKVDRQNGVGLNFGNLVWHDVPVRTDVEKIVDCPVIVENDAKLAGLSEARLVKTQYSKVFYLTVGTGIGGAYIINGNLDPDTLDAEVGHTVYEHDGQPQEWEDFASGKAIVKKYGKRASEIEDPAIWQEIAQNIAVGLINAVATLDPDVIIIGGGVGVHLDKFKDQLEQALRTHPDPMVTVPPILKAQRPEEAVIYGCFELAKNTR
jgi:glucokinase